MRRLVAVLVALFAAAAAPAAHAAFPWHPGPDPTDYSQYRLPPGTGQAPADLDDDERWMYSATPESTPDPAMLSDRELGGVRGARLVDDAVGGDGVAWRTTTGRPDVVIAVHDSGIKWDDRGAMVNVRKKTWLNAGELPAPRVDREVSLEDGAPCSSFAAPGWAPGEDDVNGDGVFDVVDFACDARVEKSGDARVRRGQPRGNGVDDLLDPQDILIAFSDGTDADGNGFVDDIVGWDFLDDDNDPYDDVQYGHGTGEAQDSAAEADNGQGGVGTCPNCRVMIVRVGDSFVADVNRFAQGVLYATDNGASVVQEALGTLNNSKLARDAVRYAYDHGVTIVASAADEAAQHHHWPESYPGVIVVNSVTKYDELTPEPKSYLQFNGCTNFSSKISIAIPSTSCSSDATGRGAGMAGLVYSAALDAHDRGTLAAHPDAGCRRVGGARCVVTPNEVRQLMASGAVGGTPQADDVNFALTELSCTPVPTPACTDPQLNAPGGPYWVALSPLAQTRRYPARKGFDQFYGYGRVNMARAVPAAAAGRIPPEVEILSPQWFDQVDPRQATMPLRAELDARGAPYTCRVLVAPGSYPNNAQTTDTPPGDFEVVPSPWCDGTQRTARFDGSSPLASIDLARLKSRFPATAGGFDGRETGVGGVQTANGRPDAEPYGFTVRVEVTTIQDGVALRGEDRRNLYLHHDQDLLPGWPKRIGNVVGGDVESSPLLVDLDGDNRTELVVAGSDGAVHALRPDGSELDGWPVKGDRLALHDGEPAFASGEVSDDARGAVLASLAAADLKHDGTPEVVAADLEGKVYAWRADGRRLWTRESDPNWSGRPLKPFVPERHGKRNRVQHGFLASPVLADLDGDGRLEVIAAAMDRHLYAWHADGSPVDGFPTIVVDPSKVASIDPRSHRVDFNANAGPALNQGAIVDTPAVGDLDSDGRPDIVVGTNEEYAIDQGDEGPLNTGAVNTTAVDLISRAGLLSMSNGRVYAIKGTGDPDGDLLSGPPPFLRGWPFKVARLFSELLPVVGEGVTGAPVIGTVACPHGGTGPKVATIPDGGAGYVLNPDASSCLGSDAEGRPLAMQSDIPDGNPLYADVLALPAVGHPAFGAFAGGTSLVAPTTGLLRALDLTVNEYQGGEDSYAAWDPSTGQFRGGFPARVNDLSFLTGPSIGDVDGNPGEEIVGGTAYLDLQAFDERGQPASAAWPKLTSDWMVANPTMGPFGDPKAGRVVVAATRDGRIFAYRTQADACSNASWPRFHHDNANSGDFARDATLPGRPAGAVLEGDRIAFTAPGDDLVCGRAAAYEVQAGGGDWARVSGVTPAAPGARDSVPVPAGAHGVVRVRALDDQGNVGRPAQVTITGPPAGDAAADTTAAPAAAPPGAGVAGRCIDRLPPALTARVASARRGRVVLRGATRERGCSGAVRRVTVSLLRLGTRRARGTAHWSLTLRGLRRGRYVATLRAVDAAGNVRRLTLRFKVR